MARKFSNGVDLQGQRGQNFANGTAPSDAVNLAQLLAYVNGLDWHLHARVAAPGNLNVSSPGATIDGVTMNAGDRVLLPNQTTASQNLIYLWQSATTAMTVAADSVQGELDVDSTISISEGATYGGKSFTLVTKAPITVGTTSLSWGFNNAAVVYTALANGGLILNGSNAFSIDTTKVVSKFAQTIGDGTSTAFTITHNLATISTGDVMIQAFLLGTGEVIEADVSARTTTGFTITFGTAPAANSVRMVVQG